jgi:uncharacterized protein GlcG (DUF336 family)
MFQRSYLACFYYHSRHTLSTGSVKKDYPGGSRFVMENKIIGGFGPSGATWEDGVIARAGLTALGADTGALDECLELYGIPREKW